MYYEFYADQFFLEHFLADCTLLGLSALVTHQTFRLRRILAGGAAGAAGMTALICAGYPQLWPLCLLLALLGQTGLRRRPVKWWGRQLLALLFVTLCFGGVLEALNELYGLPVSAGTAVATGILYQGFRRRSEQRGRDGSLVRVSITVGENRLWTTGLIDTGNQLTEPLTGRGVSILSPESAGALLQKGWEQERGMCLIPYHTILGNGWMKAVVADRMETVWNGQTVLTERPVLAISAKKLSLKAAYGILLHPMHAGNG